MRMRASRAPPEPTPMTHTHPTHRRSDPGAHLHTIGALHTDDDDTRLDAAVAADWEAAIERFRATALDAPRFTEALASLVGTAPDRVRVTPVRDSDRISVHIDEALVGQWVSDAALIADVAASTVLAVRDPQWDDLPVATRGHLLSTLRVYTPSCPRCAAPVELVVHAPVCSCEGPSAYRFDCAAADCGVTLYRIDKPTADAFI